MLRQKISVVLLITLLIPAAILVVVELRTPKPVPVGSFYYLWYGDASRNASGLDSSGWNNSSSPGGGAIVDAPTFGYYISDSNLTFGRQIGQMKGAGLSFAIVSWWGPSTLGEAGAIDKATHDLFRYLAGSGTDFQVAIMVDAYNGSANLSNSTVARDYNYIYSNFFVPFKHAYFTWEGKPLVLFFNPVRPSYDDSRFIVRTIGNRPNHVDWTFWDAPMQYFSAQNGTAVNATNDEGNPVISGDGEVTLVPRIDSYYNRGYQRGSYLRFDPALDEGLYGEQWNFTINHRGQVSLVLIYSWNEYHERSEIEPHVDLSGVAPSYLLDETSRYVTRLNG